MEYNTQEPKYKLDYTFSLFNQALTVHIINYSFCYLISKKRSLEKGSTAFPIFIIFPSSPDFYISLVTNLSCNITYKQVHNVSK